MLRVNKIRQIPTDIRQQATRALSFPQAMSVQPTECIGNIVAGGATGNSSSEQTVSTRSSLYGQRSGHRTLARDVTRTDDQTAEAVNALYESKMGRKLRHMLIFLLIILKELNIPEAGCSCPSSSSRCICRKRGLISIPPNLPTSISDVAVAGIALIGTIILTKWYKRRMRHPPGLNSNAVGSNTNTTVSVIDNCDDQAGQGQSLSHNEMLAALKPNAMYAGVGTSLTSQTASGHDQTGQGQSQAIAESTRNTMATVTASIRDQTGQGQPRAISKSNTNATATIMASIHDQTGQGQSHADQKFLEVRSNKDNCDGQAGQGQPPSHNEILAALKPNAMYAGVGTSLTSQTASGHDQTGQGQSQAIAESTRNTMATVTASIRDQTGQGQPRAISKSNTNATATIMASIHDQTGQGQSHADQKFLEVRSNKDNCDGQAGQGQPPSHNEILAALKPNAMYAGVGTSLTSQTASGHDQTGQGQSQAIAESTRNTMATVTASIRDQTGQGQPRAISKSNTNATATIMASIHDQTGQGQSHADQKFLEVRSNEVLAALKPNPMYADVGTPLKGQTASDHDQTGQGQSQAITESNTNPKATVMTSIYNQTGQGQSQAITESLDDRNLSYGTGLTAYETNSHYAYVD
ncbi:hypothetical protein Bbelb_382190 [Branchiostoma belcheri]|nr:hypothetical protein Bbelb_382190 [Branchiostoma belcheri]